MKREVKRKIRIDKKRDVKPVINIELKDAIYRLSFITYTPVKDVCEKMCVYVLSDQQAIEHLSKYFKRNCRMGSTLYMGHITNPGVSKRLKGITERVTVRFTHNVYESIAVLSYALDCSPSRTVAILLSAAMHNSKYVNKYTKTYLAGELNENQMREMQQVIRYINFVGEKHNTWAALLAHIVDEVSAPVTRVKDAVSEFLSTFKEKDK